MNEFIQSPQPYKYTKLDKLPKQLRYSCKKGDVDTVLGEGALSSPFHKIYMTKGPFIFHSELQQHHKQENIVVAAASSRFYARSCEFWDYRHVYRTIHIYSVPVEFVKTVRTQLKHTGIQQLIEWLEYCSNQPETWQEQNHEVQMWFSKLSETLSMEPLKK